MGPRVLAVFSTCCFLLATSTAFAGVITFDDLPNIGCGGTPIPTGYSALNWKNFGYDNATVPICSVVGYATALTSSPNVGFNEVGNPASITSAIPFTLLSGEFAAAWNDGLMVSITAKLGATIVGTENFTLSTTTKVLETFSFGNVTELDFSSSGGTPNPIFAQYGVGTEFAVDNLTVSAVPEPSSFGLLMFALLLVGTISYRRNRLSTRTYRRST